MELNTKTAEASSIVTARNQLLRFAELAYLNYGDIGFTVRVPYKQILFERQFTAIGNTRTGRTRTVYVDNNEHNGFIFIRF